MTNRLLNAGTLFQTLLENAMPSYMGIAGDLDVDSYDEVPFVTHSETIAQNANANGLWNVTLVLNLFLEPEHGFRDSALVYAAVHAWGEDPDAGIVPNIGGVETVDDLDAFTPRSGVVVMNNKSVRHYQGSFSLGVQIH